MQVLLDRFMDMVVAEMVLFQAEAGVGMVCTRKMAMEDLTKLVQKIQAKTSARKICLF